MRTRNPVRNPYRRKNEDLQERKDRVAGEVEVEARYLRVRPSHQQRNRRPDRARRVGSLGVPVSTVSVARGERRGARSVCFFCPVYVGVCLWYTRAEYRLF